MTHAAENLGAVIFNLHPAAATVTPLPPPQFVIDQININRQARGQAFYDSDQRAAVGFSCCCETKHLLVNGKS